MRAVSTDFLNVVTGSHKMVARATILTGGPPAQFGLAPSGTVVPILSGDVKLSATADVKATLEMETSGDYWAAAQPYGAEVFVERGVDFGNGTREYVGLGYYRIDEVEQDDAPFGPIRISASDRTVQMQQNRVTSPYQFTVATSHRAAFQRLVNGDAGGGQSTAGYGMYYATAVPITWTGYDPDVAMVPVGAVVKDSTYDFLAGLAADQGCVLRFNAAGELTVISTDVASSAAVYAIAGGHGGTMIRASRTSSRRGVYNAVSAYGSDPAFPTTYALALNTDATSSLYWAGRFGVAVRYFASPLLKDDSAAASAAATVLSRATGLPTTLSLFTVPNPALEPLDVVSVRVSPTLTETHVIDAVTIPLTADGGVQIETRTLNAVEEETP